MTNAATTTEEVYWFGRPISELSKDELMEIVKYSAKKLECNRIEIERMRVAVDFTKYMTNGAA